MSMSQLAPAASVAGQAAALALLKLAPTTVTALVTKAALPLLVSVIRRLGYRPPTVCEPNSSGNPERADKVTTGAGTGTPVPDSDTAALPLLASEFTANDALREPAAVGLKVTVMSHSAAGASVLAVLQVPDRVKSPAAAPVTAKPAKVSVASPAFCTVMVWLPGVPTCRLPKLRARLLSEMRGRGVGVAVPVNVTLCGLPTALLVMARVALLVPAAAGS